jgi:ATP-dependent Clp protease ATP-binding subunit ClpB
MTSNIGSEYLGDASASFAAGSRKSEAGGRRSGEPEIPEKVRKQVLDLLKTHFRPEFLNRLDETVLFKPLGHAQIAAIVRLQLEDLRARLAEQELSLDIDEKAIAWLADKGFDPVYGARPVKRALQRELETPVARKIVAGDYAPGATVRVTVAGDALKLA